MLSIHCTALPDYTKGASLNSKIQDRIAAIRQALVEKELDALMVSIQENRYYLSGFTGEDTQFDESAGVLIISDRHLVLATDSRYELQAQTEAAGFDIVCYKKGLEKELPEIARTLDIRRLGFECVRLSQKNYSSYAHRTRQDESRKGVDSPRKTWWKRCARSNPRMRSNAPSKPCGCAEWAFAQTLDTIRPGMTEKQVAWSMEKTMREAGAQGLSFPVIVASGPNSALPHAVPTDRRLERGEPILVDWGARLDEYCSDTTRTVVTGPTGRSFKKVFDTVVRARDMAIAAIKAGASGTGMDKIARDHISRNGFAGKFGHSLGHGTGLAVHENPRLSPIKDDRLEAGMIVTVEPGIYLPGWGGIRMENQVVVRQNGAQVLNDPATV
jgi:Xaa-Pro aminopeptidase